MKVTLTSNRFLFRAACCLVLSVTVIRARTNSAPSPLGGGGRSPVWLQRFMAVATTNPETGHTEGQRTVPTTPPISSNCCAGLEELASRDSPQNCSVLFIITCVPQARGCICKTRAPVLLAHLSNAHPLTFFFYAICTIFKALLRAPGTNEHVIEDCS